MSSYITKRLCPCATEIDEAHGYGCEITGDSCIFLIPNSKACAEFLQEGPEVDA